MTFSDTALRIVFALSVLAIPHLAQAQSFNADETVAVTINNNHMGTDLVGVTVNNDHMTADTIAVTINNNHQPMGGFGF